MDGKQRLTVELDGDFRDTWDELNDKDCEVTVKKYRKRRSLDANAYAWTIIGKIAEKKHITKSEVYRQAVKEVGGASEVLCMKKSALRAFTDQWSRNGIGWQVEEIGCKTPGWTNVIIYYGSSTYDTNQMSQLIDCLIQDAMALGIEVRPEEEIQSLIKEYDKC